MLNWRLQSVRGFAFVLVLSNFSASCLFKKPPQAFTPPPPEPQKTVTGSAPTLSPPPLIAGDPMETIPVAPSSIPEIPAPPAPKPPPKKGVPTAPPKVASPATPTEQPAPPRLGPMLTPEQLRDFNRALDESLDRVNKALVTLAKKPLNSDQVEVMNRIATFKKQAEQVRDQDLMTSVNLAKRADALATDLLNRMQ